MNSKRGRGSGAGRGAGRGGAGGRGNGDTQNRGAEGPRAESNSSHHSELGQEPGDEYEEEQDKEEVTETGSRKKPRKKRAPNWTRGEAMALIELKAVEHAEWKGKTRRERGNLPANTRWKQFAEKMTEKSIERDGEGCKRKWESLEGNYRQIKDYSRRTDANFFTLAWKEILALNLPTTMDQEMFEAMDAFLSDRGAVAPQHLADSDQQPHVPGNDTRASTGADSNVNTQDAGGSSGRRKKITIRSLVGALREGNSMAAEQLEIRSKQFQLMYDLEKERTAASVQFATAFEQLTGALCSYLKPEGDRGDRGGSSGSGA